MKRCPDEKTRQLQREQSDHHLYEIYDVERKDGIRGRREAKRLEDEYIEAYRAKHGVKPPGNT